MNAEAKPITLKNATLFSDIDPLLLKKFKTYHAENPHVYIRFLKLAKEMKRTGRKRYSQWIIINKMRWDSDIKTKDEVFKISNDYIALYARMVVYNHPEFSGFFELKKMKKVRKIFDSKTIKRARADAQIEHSAGIAR